MSVYLVEPLDTQFYRGTLPFDAGADGFATTEPLPWPSTLYGAWRTVGLVKSGHLHRNQVAAHKVWGDKHQRGSFTLKGPLLWCGRGLRKRFFSPCLPTWWPPRTANAGIAALTWTLSWPPARTCTSTIPACAD